MIAAFLCMLIIHTCVDQIPLRQNTASLFTVIVVRLLKK